MKPKIVTDEELAAHLQDMLNKVKEGDSSDGSFKYSLIGPNEWEVRAVYGVGLLEGRNIRRVIGEIL